MWEKIDLYIAINDISKIGRQPVRYSYDMEHVVYDLQHPHHKFNSDRRYETIALLHS